MKHLSRSPWKWAAILLVLGAFTSPSPAWGDTSQYLEIAADPLFVRPAVLPMGANWCTTWPTQGQVLPQRGYLDADGDGCVSSGDQIFFQRWHPIEWVGPFFWLRDPQGVLTAFKPQWKGLRLAWTDPAGQRWLCLDWNDVRPGTTPGPFYEVGEWLDDGDGVLGAGDQLRMAHGCVSQLCKVEGVMLGIQIPGDEPVALPTLSWGGLRSLFSF